MKKSWIRKYFFNLVLAIPIFLLLLAPTKVLASTTGASGAGSDSGSSSKLFVGGYSNKFS